MKTQLLDTVLLFSLPASGKSEVRKYMANLTPEQCQNDMHMGSTLQLDDYPYVHLMHRIDDELMAHGWDYVYYKGPNRPFQDEWEWAALIELLNEDYDDLANNRITTVVSAAQHLFDRLDRAHAKVGLPEYLAEVPYGLRQKVAAVLEEECRAELEVKNKTAAQDRKGKTIIIEAARGGPNGAGFPLTPPVGYQAAFDQLSEQILERATILYIWVDPAESRRKNIERGQPNGQGSILHHSVPMEVMLSQYGCDDMEYLMSQSGKPNTIKVERIFEDQKSDGTTSYRARTFYIPVARFDNRKDRTTFVRVEKALWAKADVDSIHSGLSEALNTLAAARNT